MLPKTLKLILSIAICLAAGFVGSVFTTPSIPTWYADLAKPDLNPPNFVFAPVWTTLYILMGISLYLVWKNNWKIKNSLTFRKKAWNRWSERLWTGDWAKANIIAIFFFQLVLNALWSYVFFGLHRTGLALFVLAALWWAVLYAIVNFYRVSKVAAWLLVPYILWLSYAMYLNYAIYMLN